MKTICTVVNSFKATAHIYPFDRDAVPDTA